MKYSTAAPGRIFVIRLEDGEILHETLEQFARDHAIRAATFNVLGGADTGSLLVVGPEDGRTPPPIVPMETVLRGVHESAGTGTIFPNEQGEPVVHCHLVGGRQKSAVAGCIRRGVKVWHVMEVILVELLHSSGVRALDPATGFELLQP